jgi:hypothetical protein
MAYKREEEELDEVDVVADVAVVVVVVASTPRILLRHDCNAACNFSTE